MDLWFSIANKSMETEESEYDVQSTHYVVSHEMPNGCEDRKGGKNIFIACKRDLDFRSMNNPRAIFLSSVIDNLR